MGMLFVPLSILAMADMPMEKMANGTGLFNLTRQLGGSVGIALAATLLTHFRAVHKAELLPNINVFSATARERVALLTRGLAAKGAPLEQAREQALRVLDLAVGKQAMMLSFEQLFLWFGLGLGVGLPLLLLMRRGQGGGGDAAVH